MGILLQWEKYHRQEKNYFRFMRQKKMIFI